MKTIRNLVLTGLAVAAGIGAAGPAAAGTTDLGNATLPSVVPLSGLLDPQEKPASAAELPAADATVEGLLPGR
ncbi:hypothetical protein [Streptomyces sp. NPDC096030]|uniref:hypothetical protein n=1 Tax=Streptomyces sp. NPDC096030 TaxID=3155423 RepID=UPI00331C0323